MEDLNLEILKEIGHKTKQLRKEVSKIAKCGVGILEIINFIEKKIFDFGYSPAFPCTVSINEVAAHYTIFDENYILKKGDLIKIDFGIEKDGYITDNATTIEIDTKEFEKLQETNFLALNEAISKITVGTSMSDIGKIVNDIAKKEGFNTIHNLSGHQIGRYDLHCGFSIPNYENGDLKTIENNTQFAIEPFFTKGIPKIKASGNSNILHLVKDKPIRDVIARKLLLYIKEFYPKLPFSKRWLVKDIISNISNEKRRIDLALDKKKVLYGLRILKQHGVIYEYEMLSSVDGERISQYEDCIIIKDNIKTVITRV